MTTISDRFWSKVDKTDSCWLWTACKNRKGYGHFSVGGRSGRPHLAHRMSYEFLIGPIPQGLTIDHLCKNKACVNPEHLEAVPNAVNTGRSDRATKTECVHGHIYAKDGVSTHNKKRYCLGCKREWMRLRRLVS